MPYGDAAWRVEKRLAMPPGVCSNFPYCSRLASAGAKRCDHCLERLGEWRRKQRQVEVKVPGICSVHDCKKPANVPHKMCADCRPVANDGVKARNRKLKAETFLAYGNKCACCAEAGPSFLSIDHIDGYDGTGPRKSVPLYRWLKKNGYPAAFQLLCMNCNASRGYYGYCPHRPREAANDRFDKDRTKSFAKKRAVFERYGGSFCACCNETEFEFLCLDHIDGDGARHRREIGNGISMTSWAAANDYPSWFQVLCINCNFAKRDGEHCSHSKAKVA